MRSRSTCKRHAHDIHDLPEMNTQHIPFSTQVQTTFRGGVRGRAYVAAPSGLCRHVHLVQRCCHRTQCGINAQSFSYLLLHGQTPRDLEPAERSLRHGTTNTTMCNKDSQREFAVWLRELKPVLCDNLGGWDGVGGGSGGRGHMYACG